MAWLRQRGASRADLTTRSRNYAAIQRESAAMGVVNAASVFLPVFLVRLGASNLQVSLLSALPAITGFALAIPIGSFLQSRRNIVPWYAAVRGIQFLVYAATAVAVAIVPRDLAVVTVLVLWGAFTIPSVAGAVASNGVLNSVAGPSGRYDLLSRRYGIMGLTTAITVAIVGQVLGAVGFALNYQLVFLLFSAAGMIGSWFALRITVPDHAPPVRLPGAGLRSRLRAFVILLRGERAFVRFVLRGFLLTFGLSIATPLIPLWYIREAHAPDAWIGVIGTAQSLAMLAGYYAWRRMARGGSTRLLFLVTTLGIALYPGSMALSRELAVIAIVIAYGAFMNAGLNLALFDELMKTVPANHVVTFTGVQTSLSNLAAIVAPLIGGLLADTAGIGPGLLVAAVVALLGGLLLVLARPAPATA